MLPVGIVLKVIIFNFIKQSLYVPLVWFWTLVVVQRFAHGAIDNL